MAGDVGLGTELIAVPSDEGGIQPTIEACPVDLSNSAFQRLELVWPGKDQVQTVRQRADGAWEALLGAADFEAQPLLDIANYPKEDELPSSLLVNGDRICALRSMRALIGRSVRMAYVDAPRIGVDDLAAAFRGDTNLVYSTWLSVLRTHLLAVEPLLARDGVVVIHVGENEAGAARLLADELFRGQHVGTVVWQRSYAPRNMPGMRDFTATHDCLIIYAKQKDALPPVGLRRPPAGFTNPDDDPRGSWKAEHKGAASRRENSDFDTYVPPYRWEMIAGELPPGIWRVSPFTGVIWGVPTKVGRFEFTVQATDASADCVTKSLCIDVLGKGEKPAPIDIPWLFAEIETDGELRIETAELPKALLGESYSAICLGAGGSPYKDAPKRPGSGRYWEFARDTLLKAYREDAVYLGAKKPSAIPHPKAYAPQEEGALVVENQQTWWPGRTGSGAKTSAFTGYTEDATKHLKALRAIGAITMDGVSAKPEVLLARLLQIFTGKNDLVLEVFAQAADMAAVAIKTGRRFVALSGNSARDNEIALGCAIPRLRAIVDGLDKDLTESRTKIKLRTDGYIPFDGGGAFAVCRVGDWVIKRKRAEDFAEINNDSYQRDSLRSAILTVQGYLPVRGKAAIGKSFIGDDRMSIVLEPDQYLTPEFASSFVSDFGSSEATIFYFRSSEDFDPSDLPSGVLCKRVPFELGI